MESRIASKHDGSRDVALENGHINELRGGPPSEEEVRRIDAAIERACRSGGCELVVVAGGSPERRARLARASKKRAVDAQARVLSAEVNSEHASTPHGTLAFALEALAPTLVDETGPIAARLRQRLAEAVLGQGLWLAELCPTLASLVPAERPIERLPITLAEQRAELLLSRVIAALAQPERPLVVWLEDVDQASPATRRVLKRALAHPETRYLTVVVTSASAGSESSWRGPVGDFLDLSGGRHIEGVLLGHKAEDNELPAERAPRDPEAVAAKHLELARSWGANHDKGARRCLPAAHLALAVKGNAHEALAREEKLRLAAVALTAVRHARIAGEIEAMSEYLDTAAALLGGAHGEEKPPRELTWEVLSRKAECAAAREDRAATEAAVDALRLLARSDLERQTAERAIVELLTRLGEPARAMAHAASSLANLGVNLPEGRDAQTIRSAVDAVWDALGERGIEEIGDLEPMTNPVALAATETLFAALPSARALGSDAQDLVACELARLALQHGCAAPSVLGLAAFGTALVRSHGDHRSGYRFGKVALDLCEQLQSPLHCGIVGAYFAENVSIWTHHLRASIKYSERARAAALASGNLSVAHRTSAVATLFTLLKGDALEGVLREASSRVGELDMAADKEALGELFEAIERFVRQQKGPAAPRPTRRPSSLPPTGDAALTASWGTLARRLLELMALVLAGEYDEAVLCSNSLRPHLTPFASQILVPEERYYSALAEAARRPVSGESPDARAARFTRLDESVAMLERWAERCPENYRHKHALVLAERHRLAGAEVEAMRLYDQAIASARENGFTQHEGLAAECAVRFYVDRGFPTIAAAYLRLARAAFARWGADDKVDKLERSWCRLAAEAEPLASPLSLGAKSGLDFDFVTAVRTAQAVSEEIVLQRLIVTLMRLVIEHGGAERCHVLLAQDGDLVHAGRAFIASQGIEIEVPGPPSTDGASLPESVIGYVRRTREPILLDDATAEPSFSADPYVARKRPRSLLCLPITRQGELVGMFYMENNLVPGAFTPRRLSLLEFLATQAAISLEHAKLYTDLARENSERRRTEETLRRSEERLRRLVESANVIPWEADAETEVFTYVGPQAEERLGWAPSTWYKPNFLRDHTHPEDRALALSALARTCALGDPGDAEFRLCTRDGRAVWLHMVVSLAEREGGTRIVSGFFFDVTRRKETEAALREQIAIIAQQREDIRTLSTPLLDVWEGVVAMPVLGALNEERAARAMEVLLATISQKSVRCAILDLTGVTSIDQATAEHMVRMVRAVELLGARAIVVGIKPDVARMIVSLGLSLDRVETRATLRDALRSVSPGREAAVLLGQTGHTAKRRTSSRPPAPEDAWIGRR